MLSTSISLCLKCFACVCVAQHVVVGVVFVLDKSVFWRQIFRNVLGFFLFEPLSSFYRFQKIVDMFESVSPSR